MKLGSDGSFLQVEQIVQETTSSYRAVTVDDGGNIYVTADFGGTSLFPTGDLFTAMGASKDAYLLKLTTAPGVSVSPTTGLVTQRERRVGYVRRRVGLPATTDVAIDLTSSDSGEGDVSPARLPFYADQLECAANGHCNRRRRRALIDGDSAFTIVTRGGHQRGMPSTTV